MSTSLKMSIRLSKHEVTSISLKIPVVAVWAMLGSKRDYIFKNGVIDENKSPGIYSMIYGSLSDFAYFWIIKFWDFSKGKKGLSDYVLNCILKDIVKSSIPGNLDKAIPKYTPKQYFTILKCLERGY